MLIVLTNDDGIGADGIEALHRQLSRAHDVFVVAPDSERSACSHGISLRKPLRIKRHARRWYSVDGTPVDCVNLAVFQILARRRPDWVISGINQGPNLGSDILYSGTVAGALEGALLGIPALAVSLDSFDEPAFGPSAAFTAEVVRRLGRRRLPPETCLNVNVPLAPAAGLPARLTHLGRRRYRKVIRRGRDRLGRPWYFIGGDPVELDSSDTCDSAAVRGGLVSVTPLTLDLTARHRMDAIARHLGLNGAGTPRRRS